MTALASTWEAGATAPRALFERIRLERTRVFLLVWLTGLLPLSRVFPIGAKDVNLAVADALLPLGALFLCWRSLSGGLRLPCLTLFFLSVASYVASLVANLELTVSRAGPESLFVELLKYLLLWLYFFLPANLMDSQADMGRFLKAWVVMACASSLTGIGGSLYFQATGVENPFSLMYRAQGTFSDSNLFATHLGVGVLMALAHRDVTRKSTWWHWAAILILVAGVVLSASRGGLLAMVAAILLWGLIRDPFRTFLGGSVLFIAAGMLAGLVPDKRALLESNDVTARLASTTEVKDDSALARFALWEEAMREFGESPILGVGKGNYGMMLPYGHAVSTHAHNTVLSLLCEGGIAGLASNLALGLAALWWLSGAFRGGTPRARQGSAALASALILITLSGSTISMENYRGLWMLLGAADAFRRLYITREAAA